jgi:hypothetical protein
LGIISVGNLTATVVRRDEAEVEDSGWWMRWRHKDAGCALVGRDGEGARKIVFSTLQLTRDAKRRNNFNMLVREVVHREHAEK